MCQYWITEEWSCGHQVSPIDVRGGEGLIYGVHMRRYHGKCWKFIIARDRAELFIDLETFKWEWANVNIYLVGKSTKVNMRGICGWEKVCGHAKQEFGRQFWVWPCHIRIPHIPRLIGPAPTPRHSPIAPNTSKYPYPILCDLRKCKQDEEQKFNQRRYIISGQIQFWHFYP